MPRSSRNQNFAAPAYEKNASFRNQRQGVPFERASFQTRHPQPVLDVLARLFGCQGLETAHDGDALPELYQFGPRQLLSQLRLTRQNDLHQLRAA